MADDSPSSLRLGRAVLPRSWQVLSCQGVFLRLKAVKMNRYVESVEKDCMMTFMEKYVRDETPIAYAFWNSASSFDFFYSSGSRYPMLFRGSQGLNPWKWTWSRFNDGRILTMRGKWRRRMFPPAYFQRSTGSPCASYYIPWDPCMLYMVTFPINIPQMLAYIPYIDPMGMDLYGFEYNMDMCK
jgi:hypothetical protein